MELHNHMKFMQITSCGIMHGSPQPYESAVAKKFRLL
jgi:hypothetical protein